MKKLLLIFMFLVSLTSAKAQEATTTVVRDTLENKIATGPRKHNMLFSVQGGLAFSMNEHDGFKSSLLSMEGADSEVNDFIYKLVHGYHVSSSLHYLVTSYFCLGIDYNLFFSASKGQFVGQGYSEWNIPVYMVVDLDERIYNSFVGVSAFFQQVPDESVRIKFSESISSGIVTFREETRVREFKNYYDQFNSVTKGSTFGIKGGLAIDYGITSQLSAGVSVNFTLARLKKLSVMRSFQDINDFELEDPMNISHLDYGLNIRYNF